MSEDLLKAIDQLIQRSDQLRRQPLALGILEGWRLDAITALSQGFGSDSQWVKDFSDISLRMPKQISTSARADICRQLGVVFAEDIDFESLESEYTNRMIFEARAILEYARRKLRQEASDKGQ